MAEANEALNVLVTGGAEGVGLATARALLRRGHKVLATACDAEGALALRQVGALPVYPDLARASEVGCALQLAEADVLIHAGPQYFGGAPQTSAAYAAYSDQLLAYTAAVVEAAKAQAVKRHISLSFAYLYDTGSDAAKEGDQDVHDAEYQPMLQAEAIVRDSGLDGYIIRSGYIYGGHSADSAALADSIKRSQRLPAGLRPASWIHEDDLAAAITSLLEAESDTSGVEIINAADDSPRSPNEFAEALAEALGLSAAAFAGDGFLSALRRQTMQDKLLSREIVVSSERLRERFAWQPRHGSIETGMEATALVWRMKDAVKADDYYNKYEDAAAAAIASFAYDVALPEPACGAGSAGRLRISARARRRSRSKRLRRRLRTGRRPWNEDDAKREERRRRALERKAKRAARSAGG